MTDDIGNDIIGGDMAEDDQRILRHWRDSLILLDVRYEDRRLAKIAARAMTDPVFRASALPPGETEAAPYDDQTPVEIRFHVNTPTVLHVVLPPPAGEAARRPPSLREALRSRTSLLATAAIFNDDWNISDPGTDPPIFTGPQTPDGTDGHGHSPGDMFQLPGH
ncbi:hypothetical protein ACIBCT_38965 [Streptosporangium sp. NPDC050855]|uniref:hypothetical protein n=1 Tax=Streptosporangium sp. NPDC050855 TaxID=3366194 RepID=UPI00378F7927